MAQLRTELESTRAVAARLAGLLRSRAAGGTLVPVRDSRAVRPEAGPGPSTPEPTPAAHEPGPDLPAAGTAGDPPAETG
jgi:hypothetical protein